MMKISQNLLGGIFIVMLLVIAFSVINYSNKHPEQWSAYWIKEQDVKLIVKKHTECGVREVVSGGRRLIRSHQEIYNIYMFVYEGGEVEEVSYEKYYSKKENDTVVKHCITSVSKEVFEKINGYKIEDKNLFYSLKSAERYRIIYINNKPTDTLEIPY